MTASLVGVSLKMYFGHMRTGEWLSAVAALARRHPAITSGRVRLFVMPGFLSIRDALDVLSGTAVLVGSQDLATADSGPYTGEVSAAELAEIGVALAEVGHAERRTLFGETDALVAAKTAAALRNGLTPVICVGEDERVDSMDAARFTVDQLRRALADAQPGAVIVAYEPIWAIGAAEAAPPDHIATVCRAVRESLSESPGRSGSRVIYGGSAGPGLLAALADNVDGLFLGRSAHDIGALEAVVNEADG